MTLKQKQVDPGFWIGMAMIAAFLCAKYLGII